MFHTDSGLGSRLDPALEKLLGPSQLFETAEETKQLSEAELLLKDKCTLYKVATDSSNCCIGPLIAANKKHRKKTESATAGPNWFNMSAPELTPEVKADLEAVQLRRYINPKIFYKKKDVDQLPKYFQIGTVLPSPEEPRSLQVGKDRKRKSLVEQMLMEDEERQFSRRKLETIQAAKKRLRHRGPKTYKKRRLGMSR